MPMKLKVLSVYNRGDATKEHVLLEAVEDCNANRYLLADSTFTGDGMISNRLRHTFWFPSKAVKKGELVSLWTGKGSNTEAANAAGTKIHRFYWNLGSAVWNDDGDCALLIEVSDWKASRTK
ncbi:hypothetical protein QMO56_11280 [Roseomonas sp. E05]|uniref:hypothetical protein n=1 Tax=Roseomonas sp. E05 TaxID=3046310 RepID=UPI0024BA5D59|nr:hypothetical protein [Roseomonas sp. E05]MDJ0388695.1 hypothetical protein [Roseomonas sp. E05]